MNCKDKRTIFLSFFQQSICLSAFFFENKKKIRFIVHNILIETVLTNHIYLLSIIVLVSQSKLTDYNLLFIDICVFVCVCVFPKWNQIQNIDCFSILPLSRIIHQRHISSP